MLKRDLFRVEAGLNSVGNLKGVKFLYAVAKNKVKISRECKALRESIQPSEEYVKYDNERLEICRNLAEKDKDGNPVMIGNSFKDSNQKKFDKELTKIRKNYNGAIEERKKELEDFEKFLDDKTDIELHLVKTENVPEGINAEQMSNLIEIIDD